jgi:FKBP-type peptidyl-prolyl cis-trans isomerase SlyD
MIVAVPSDSPGGFEARISDHFGHCDVFTLVEIDGEQVGAATVLPNQAHESGQCMGPVNLLKEQGAEALVAGGMGARPLSGFQEVGIAVYFREGAETVRDAIDLLIAGQCREFGPAQTCAGHGSCASHEEAEREVVDGPVEKDRVVLVSFRLTDAEGELIDSSDGIRYMHGRNQLLPGLERTLQGLVAGERTQATIAPADGYGERDESRVIQVPLKDLPLDVAPGATLQGRAPDGQVWPFAVVSIDESAATLDANHPLAGKTLVFDVEVRQVYAATAEDLARGHVH